MSRPPAHLVDRIGSEKLAALPQVTLRLLQACNNPRVGLAELSDIIVCDGALLSRVIQVANTPLYGQRGLTDPRRILAVLGFNTVRALAITAGVMELFSRLQPRRNHWLGTFWQRSLLCAHLGRSLAQQGRLASPEEAYLVGLLHKVGQLVLLNTDVERYGTLLQDTLNPEALCHQERALFGADHVELGAWLVAQWGLAGFPSDAIRYQREPAQQVLDAPPLIRVVNLAARLSEPWLMAEARASAERQAGISPACLEQLWNQTQREVTQTAQVFGIEIAPWETLSLSPPPNPFPEERAVLAETVRDAALLDSLRAALGEESLERRPGLVIQKFLTLLFGLEHPEVFLVEPDKGLHDEARPEFSLPLAPERSLPGHALAQAEILDSFQYQALGKSLGILDRLLIQRHGDSGLLALPLVARGEGVGVVVVGAESGTLAGFGPYLDLLRLFLEEAAELVLRHREAQRQRHLLLAEGQAQALLNARKVRHEINNPLGILNSYLHLLGMKLGADHPVRADLDMLGAEIERITHILSGLTERLAETDGGDSVRVNALLTRLEAVWRESLFQTPGLEVRLELDTALGPIGTDPDKLKQILLNLVKNAVEAMPRGGELVIVTRASFWIEAQRFLAIQVRDSGPGLPPEVQEHLFEPVSSTKGERHSGLGLAISAQLARELGGRLQCHTGIAGTEFTLLLPWPAAAAG